MKILIENGRVVAEAENVEEIRTFLAMPVSAKLECEICGQECVDARGLGVHKTKMHSSLATRILTHSPVRHMPKGAKLVRA